MGINTLIRRFVLWYLRKQPSITVICRNQVEHLFLPTDEWTSEHIVNLADLLIAGRLVIHTHYYQPKAGQHQVGER